MPKYVVRHGVMRQLGVFSSRGRDRYARGHKVIARTGRGQESGEVLCEATPHVQSQMTDPRSGQILRQLTPDDERELQKIEQQAQQELDVCKDRVKELGLEMQMVDAERLYGGERAVFYYLAEGRIDFRELVKQLAKEFQTRIEMRQIGVRDEAKLLADYGDCGKPVCCNTHLSEMPPVSMKMAKLQKATLDPTKISGRCGRLKCCLRYEYDTYRTMQKDLPRVGSEIITNQGRGKVLAQEILASQVLVQTEDMRRVVVNLSDVLSVLPRGQGQAKQQGEPSAGGEAARKASAQSKGGGQGKDGGQSKGGGPPKDGGRGEGGGQGESGEGRRRGRGSRRSNRKRKEGAAAENKPAAEPGAEQAAEKATDSSDKQPDKPAPTTEGDSNGAPTAADN